VRFDDSAFTLQSEADRNWKFLRWVRDNRKAPTKERVRAAIYMLEWLRPQVPVNALAPTVINVALVASPAPAQPELPAGSFTLHLPGHGHAGADADAGDGGVRDAGGWEDLGGVRDDDCPRPETP
jgi:hypothetical protein